MMRSCRAARCGSRIVPFESLAISPTWRPRLWTCLELQHLFDPEGDRRAVATGPTAIRVEDDVEAFAPQRGRDPERTLALSLVAAGDDHRLRRARLPEVPCAEIDAVGGDQLDLLVVGLKLERREGEVVQRARFCRHERPAIEEVGRADVQDEQDGRDQHQVGHRDLPEDYSKTRLRAYSSSGTRRVSRMTSASGTTSTSPFRRIGITPLLPAEISSDA